MCLPKNQNAVYLNAGFFFDNNRGEIKQSQTFFGNKKTIQNAQFFSKNCNIVSYFTMKITYATR